MESSRQSPKSSFEPKLQKLPDQPHSQRYGVEKRAVSLERDPQFQRDITETLHNIKRFKGFKEKTWGRLQEMHQAMQHEKGELGVTRGRLAKINLARQQRL